ncbi:MAG: hypothetical protein WC663_03575 [Patescibacteria group bacterium]|jgi:hypothetical protein
MSLSPEQSPQLADINGPGKEKQTPGFEIAKTEQLNQFVAEADKIAKALEGDEPVLLEQVSKLKEALEKMVESDPRIEAKRLFGEENYMGPDEIEAYFTVQDENGNVENLFEYTPEERQKINQMLREKLNDPQIRDLIRRTSKEELRERFQLFLFPDKFKDGTLVTMKSLWERFQPEMERRGLGKLFFGEIGTDKCWFYNDSNKEDFFTADSNQLSWKLLSKGNIEGSNNKNYVEETRFLREYLRQNNLATADELSECSDAKLTELTQLMARNWKKAAERLSELRINQKYRINPLEVIFIHTAKKSVLTNASARTAKYAKCSSGGGLVGVGFGGSGAQGAFVVRWGPVNADSDLGVSLSR